MMIISGETIIPGWSSLGAITKTIKPRTSTDLWDQYFITAETIIPGPTLRQSSQGIRTGTYITVYLDCCLVHLSVHQGYKILCTGCPTKMLTRCLCEKMTVASNQFGPENRPLLKFNFQAVSLFRIDCCPKVKSLSEIMSLFLAQNKGRTFPKNMKQD